MTRSSRRVSGALAIVSVLTLAGCAQTEVRDVLGLWASTDPTAIDGATVELEVVFVEGEDGGCWSARDATVDDARALPVSWPRGTLIGLEATLQLPDGTVVDVGDRVAVTAELRPASTADDPPAGCDVVDGYHAVTTATPLADG